MSCATLNASSVRMEVSMGALPEGFCPESEQERADAYATRLIVTPNANFTSFAAGSVAPTSNVGPWFKDCETWFVWDDATAQYVPMLKQGFNQIEVHTASDTFTVPAFIYRLKVRAWGGGGGGMYTGGATADAGGGGGGYGEAYFDVVPFQSINFVIGVGGSVGNPGNAGTATTFLTMSAGGGGGGAADPALGGVTTGATLSINGGPSGYPVSGQPSQGGLSPAGGSGGSFSGSGITVDGVFPGGGGSGGYAGDTGGNGANGQLVIEY